MKRSGLVLAGGKSSRMNYRDKAGLLVRGETFLLTLCQQFKGAMDQVMISEGKKTSRIYGDEYETVQMIKDIYEDCGPLGGLHAALAVCENELLCVAACDMPKLEVSLYDYLLRFDKEEYDAIIPTIDGSMHPLAGVYKRRILNTVEEQLTRQEYAMKRLLSKLSVCYVEIGDSKKFAPMVENINTMLEYQQLLLEVGNNNE